MGKKILMTLNSLDIGGAETHVAELSLELQRRGYQVILVSRGGAYTKPLEQAGIKHYTAPLNRRSWAAMHRARAILAQVIAQEKPDLVHAHARIPGYLCGQLQKKQHFPFVTTAHWVFHTNFLLNRITNWGQRTIAVSQDIKQYLMDNYRLPEQQITVTINGIDTGAFSPATDGASVATELGLDPSRPVLGCISRLDSDRSLATEHLLQLAPRLRQELPQLQLLLVGGGGDYPRLSQMAQQQNADAGTPYIFMTGARTDIAPLVSLCDVFVGVSRSALEAMSAAKPVLLAGNEGYQGLFTPEKLDTARSSNFCCRGSAPCTPELLLGDILSLFRLSPAERQSLGDFGRELILRDYSVTRMADDCIAVYNSL